MEIAARTNSVSWRRAKEDDQDASDHSDSSADAQTSSAFQSNAECTGMDVKTRMSKLATGMANGRC